MGVDNKHFKQVGCDGSNWCGLRLLRLTLSYSIFVTLEFVGQISGWPAAQDSRPSTQVPFHTNLLYTDTVTHILVCSNSSFSRDTFSRKLKIWPYSLLYFFLPSSMPTLLLVQRRSINSQDSLRIWCKNRCFWAGEHATGDTTTPSSERFYKYANKPPAFSSTWMTPYRGEYLTVSRNDTMKTKVLALPLEPAGFKERCSASNALVPSSPPSLVCWPWLPCLSRPTISLIQQSTS